MNTDPKLSAEILTELPLEGLLQIVVAVFEGSRIRESSHFAEGRYIRTNLGHDGLLVFERCSASEYLVHGDADFPGDLMQAAHLLNREFVRHDLVHRFEVYKGDQLWGECSHKWPGSPQSTTESAASA